MSDLHVNTKFEAFKLEKLLKTNGVDFEFKRKKKNSFNEFTDDPPEVVAVVNGVYHEQSITTQITSGQGTQFRSEKVPMVLCKFGPDVLSLKPKDLLEYNGKHYEVQGITNYAELNIVMDISLRVVDKGGIEI